MQTEVKFSPMYDLLFVKIVPLAVRPAASRPENLSRGGCEVRGLLTTHEFAAGWQIVSAALTCRQLFFFFFPLQQLTPAALLLLKDLLTVGRQPAMAASAESFPPGASEIFLALREHEH